MPVQPLASVTVHGDRERAGLRRRAGERRRSVDSVRPAGSVPLLSVNVAAPMAPLCVKVWLNGGVAVPFELAGLVTVMVWQAMKSV